MTYQAETLMAEAMPIDMIGGGGIATDTISGTGDEIDAGRAIDAASTRLQLAHHKQEHVARLVALGSKAHARHIPGGVKRAQQV